MCWGDSRCQKGAPGFTKKLYNFGAVLKVSLQFSYNTHSKPWFWSDRETAGPDRFTKPIFRTKRTPPNEETAWPGQFNGSIFDIHVTPPRCQTIAVKFWFCFCDNVTPKPFRPSPKQTATKRGNSMARPVQRNHFWTAFPPPWMPNVAPESTKNRETAWPDRFNGPIFDMHFTPPRCQTSHLNPTKKTSVLACIALHPL